MKFNIQFFAGKNGIADICIWQHRNSCAHLIQNRDACISIVQDHFEQFGWSIIDSGMENWRSLENLTDDEEKLGDWCQTISW